MALVKLGASCAREAGGVAPRFGSPGSAAAVPAPITVPQVRTSAAHDETTPRRITQTPSATSVTEIHASHSLVGHQLAWPTRNAYVVGLLSAQHLPDGNDARCACTHDPAWFSAAMPESIDALGVYVLMAIATRVPSRLVTSPSCRTT